MLWDSQVANQVLIELQHHLHTYVPVVSGTVMVGVMNGAPMVGGGEAVCVGVWPCGFVLFGVLDGTPLVGGGEDICVGVWPCGFVLVGVLDEVPIVGSDVSVTVGVRSPVGSTVLMLLVALGPVEM